ncbi:IscS subfamily cysteine desulfurase [Chitinophaga sp. Cy-1792]|uniref:IscS subfamily cysteine desulfurase n=1 Tax=Chitinophaga sp. Cy-1792 TaxID=2608339 RepID=UPI00141ECB1B|nr:IscS subfamily cysteine desulfurase [Chitinophaga sp. Cy-1792]
MKLPIYLDNNATTAVDPRVLETMLPYFTTQYGNAASRSHPFGWVAEEAVDYAREQVAQLIGAVKQEIVFTSGATEAANLAIKGVYEMYAGSGNHIITCVTEHKAVVDTCRHLEKKGAQVTWLPVNEQGLISIEALEAAITPQTILIAIMYANNETGVIQPVKEIGRIAKKHNVIYCCDATQAVGKIPVNVLEDDIDLMMFSAHKIYGPKGVGALYVRRKSPRVRLAAQIDGGGHERGMRSGTLNVPGIAGFGKACELCGEEMRTEGPRLAVLRDKLELGLLQLEASRLNGGGAPRLPHTVNISLNYLEGQTLIMGFAKKIALSSGSACTSASMEPSYVLKAMGIDDMLARNALRMGVGRFTTPEEIDFTIDTITRAVIAMREISPAWEAYKQGQ